MERSSERMEEFMGLWSHRPRVCERANAAHDEYRCPDRLHGLRFPPIHDSG